MVTETVGHPRFYAGGGPYQVAEVALAAGGFTKGSELTLTGMASLRAAGPTDVSFIDHRRYAPALKNTLAGAVILKAEMLDVLPESAIAIIVGAPAESWVQVGRLFHPQDCVQPGIHPSAVVGKGAGIHPTAEIEAFACIEDGAQIGAGCRIGSFVKIGKGVVIGNNSRIETHASISYAIIGERVCIHPGARIGQDGFGFCRTDKGYLTAPQLGRVIIEDDVEIGANSTIDRGSIQDTVIGAGSRIDNLVQIGHNVRMGRCCVIVAQVGISGSTILGDFVQVGGQAAMAGHLHIGDGAQIGAQAGVISDAQAGAILLGSPAQPRQQFFRQIAILRRMTKTGCA